MAKQQKDHPVFWRDADLPFEGRQSMDSAACYRAHTHRTFSVGIVDEGRSLLCLRGQQVQLQAGDVVIIPPGEVHSCNPAPSHRWSYRMFYLDSAWMQSAPDASATLMHDPLQRRVLRGAEAVSIIDRMTAAIVRQVSPNTKITIMRECLADLNKVARRSMTDSPDASGQGESTLIREARAYMERHASETINLAGLANKFGLTPFQFIRKFKREVGLTPHAYQLDQRVVQARELLKSSRPLADVAYALGFSDQSHFQRVFKPRVAATPGQYRREEQASSAPKPEH